MSAKTGYTFDANMALHRNVHNARHPESPARILEAYDFLKLSGVLQKCIRLKSRNATEKELMRFHTPNHINTVKAYSSDGKDDVCKIYEQWRTYSCDDTFSAAVLSAGCCFSLVDAVFANTITNGIAIVRPPGHHAESEESCGFCFFNNVVLSAKHAQCVYDVGKVLIVDWDIHHGNGTQNAFYEDDSVMYISIHRFDNGEYFPRQKDGDYCYTGSGKGEGYNVNIPWNRDIMGNTEYKAAFDRIVLPIASQFQPELVLVSCGFDAAAADVIGEYILTAPMYAYMTRKLKHVSNGKLLLFLEGGYSPKAIGQCFSACLEALLSDSSTADCDLDLAELDISDAGPCKRAEQTLQAVAKEQSKYWDLKRTSLEDKQ